VRSSARCFSQPAIVPPPAIDPLEGLVHKLDAILLGQRQIEETVVKQGARIEALETQPIIDVRLAAAVDSDSSTRDVARQTAIRNAARAARTPDAPLEDLPHPDEPQGEDLGQANGLSSGAVTLRNKLMVCTIPSYMHLSSN
jgi:hypothetical protein